MSYRPRYYVLITACVFGRKIDWLRSPCLAAALLFPAVAALHGIVLAALHVKGMFFQILPSILAGLTEANFCQIVHLLGRCGGYGHLWGFPALLYWHPRCTSNSEIIQHIF